MKKNGENVAQGKKKKAVKKSVAKKTTVKKSVKKNSDEKNSDEKNGTQGFCKKESCEIRINLDATQSGSESGFKKIHDSIR